MLSPPGRPQRLTLCPRQGSGSTPAPGGCFRGWGVGVGISTPQLGFRPALWLLPQAERKASAGQWGRQHNASPFLGCMSTNHPLKILSASSQSSMDSSMEFADDSKNLLSWIPETWKDTVPILRPRKDQSPCRMQMCWNLSQLPQGIPQTPLPTARVDSLT